MRLKDLVWGQTKGPCAAVRVTYWRGPWLKGANILEHRDAGMPWTWGQVKEPGVGLSTLGDFIAWHCSAGTSPASAFHTEGISLGPFLRSRTGQPVKVRVSTALLLPVQIMWDSL